MLAGEGCFSLDDILPGALDRRRADHLTRSRQIIRPIDSTRVEIDGQRLVNFCSNDYLGLTHHPKLLAAANRADESHGVGAGASALISGYTDLHASAERALARWKGVESAVLLPSGYQANQAVVQTIAGAAETSGARIRLLLDKLCHASLIDAARASRLPFRVFAHNDMARLERFLRDADPQETQVVLTESIFSMDGDAAPLAEMVALKARRPFTLVVDEAHASGTYGPGGAGYAAELGLGNAVDVFVVTLSKAFGCIGGAVCASTSFCDALLQFGRAYVYSTSVPASVAAVCESALDVMRDEPERQARVRALSCRVRLALKLQEGSSPIIPLVLGEERRAIEQAGRLREMGMLVMAIRPPTVPRGTSRLRVTLSCDHTDEQVSELIGALSQAGG